MTYTHAQPTICCAGRVPGAYTVAFPSTGNATVVGTGCLQSLVNLQPPTEPAGRRLQAGPPGGNAVGLLSCTSRMLSTQSEGLHTSRVQRQTDAAALCSAAILVDGAPDVQWDCEAKAQPHESERRAQRRLLIGQGYPPLTPQDQSCQTPQHNTVRHPVHHTAWQTAARTHLRFTPNRRSRPR